MLLNKGPFVVLVQQLGSNLQGGVFDQRAKEGLSSPVFNT